MIIAHRDIGLHYIIEATIIGRLFASHFNADTFLITVPVHCVNERTHSRVGIIATQGFTFLAQHGLFTSLVELNRQDYLTVLDSYCPKASVKHFILYHIILNYSRVIPREVRSRRGLTATYIISTIGGYLSSLSISTVPCGSFHTSIWLTFAFQPKAPSPSS